jgi:hypothetical protein
MACISLVGQPIFFGIDGMRPGADSVALLRSAILA